LRDEREIFIYATYEYIFIREFRALKYNIA